MWCKPGKTLPASGLDALEVTLDASRSPPKLTGSSQAASRSWVEGRSLEALAEGLALATGSWGSTSSPAEKQLASGLALGLRWRGLRASIASFFNGVELPGACTFEAVGLILTLLLPP